MGFLQDLTGSTAAKASNAAAADTFSKQSAAIAGINQAGDNYNTGMDTLSHAYDPFVATGQNANTQYDRLLTDPSSVSSLPGYQFDLGQSIQAADRGAAARGMDQSGRTLKDLTRFGTGLADNTYGQQLSRLLSGTQLGLNATGSQVGTEAQGLQGQLGARTTAYGGAMNAAGTIGQGQIAGANAEAAGSQNLLNTGVKLAGMAMGGGGVGSPSASSYMLGTPSNGSGMYAPSDPNQNMAGFGNTYYRG